MPLRYTLKDFTPEPKEDLSTAPLPEPEPESKPEEQPKAGKRKKADPEE